MSPCVEVGGGRSARAAVSFSFTKADDVRGWTAVAEDAEEVGFFEVEGARDERRGREVEVEVAAEVEDVGVPS